MELFAFHKKVTEFNFDVSYEKFFKLRDSAGNNLFMFQFSYKLS